MNHTSDPKTVTARKPHRCSWCGERIEKGSKYESTFIVCDGDPWTRKMHQECAEAERAYDYGGDNLLFEGQFERGHNHVSREWNTAEDGVKDKCPGCVKLACLPNAETSGPRSGSAASDCSTAGDV